MAQWVCESGQLGPESASLWVRQQQAASDVTRSPVPGGRVWASKCGEVGSRGLISRPRVTLPGPAPPVRRVTSEDRQPWTQAPCQGASGASLSTWVPPGPPAPSLLAFAGERGRPGLWKVGGQALRTGEGSPLRGSRAGLHRPHEPSAASAGQPCALAGRAWYHPGTQALQALTWGAPPGGANSPGWRRGLLHHAAL